MLRRPGSPPGSAWMRRLDERLAPKQADPPPDLRKQRLWWVYWAIFLVVMISGTRLNQFFVGPTGEMREYQSETKMGGVPLVATGKYPRAVIALGEFPVGIVAIGGVSVGVIALGGLALGGLALSGLSAGIFAVGGLALGWWASGGGAIGYYAFGGLAIGGHAYAGGGVAIGYHEASGGQKEKLFG